MKYPPSDRDSESVKEDNNGEGDDFPAQGNFNHIKVRGEIHSITQSLTERVTEGPD